MPTGKDIVKITALATGAFVLKSTFSRFFDFAFPVYCVWKLCHGMIFSLTKI